MTRFLAAMLAVLISFGTSIASDDIRDFVEYQKQRLRTYPEAAAFHKETKKPVIVWVALQDDDQSFQVWKATKSVGYHVFVKDFPGTYSGIVIGRDMDGKFVQYAKFASPDTDSISKAATDAIKVAEPVRQYNLPVYQLPSSCPNGKCPTAR